jgi:hypothetical protein
MQGEYLEQTIRSVLLQGYPDLEYFVLDGGSTDDSTRIIQRYAPWIAWWRSEKDLGQAAAINEGWARSSGEIVAWINSDDWYYPGAFFAGASELRSNSGSQWVSGIVDDRQAHGKMAKSHDPAPSTVAECLGRRARGYHQPGMFWRKTLLETVGRLDKDLNYVFVHDFWVRSLLKGVRMTPIAAPVANFRLHPASKTVSRHELFLKEDWKVLRRHEGKLPPAERKQAEHWLRTYEADGLLDTLYRMLAHGQRIQALRHLIARIRLLPLIHPRRLLAGLLWRILITGRPAPWFTAKTGGEG